MGRLTVDAINPEIDEAWPRPLSALGFVRWELTCGFCRTRFGSAVSASSLARRNARRLWWRSQPRTMGCRKNNSDTSGRDHQRRLLFCKVACDPAARQKPTEINRLAMATGNNAWNVTDKTHNGSVMKMWYSNVVGSINVSAGCAV